MSFFVEIALIFAALLADLWLGNFGFAPCFTMFAIFHSSRSVSLRFATVAALAFGVLTDLWYCRSSSGTPLWYVLALYAGQLALFRREDDDTGRVLPITLAGAAVGGVLTLRWTIVAGGDPGWWYLGAAVDLVSGMATGVLKLALVVLVADLVRESLGIRGFFPPKSPGARRTGTGRRRLRRVRAEKVAGKRS